MKKELMDEIEYYNDVRLFVRKEVDGYIIDTELQLDFSESENKNRGYVNGQVYFKEVGQYIVGKVNK